MINKNVLIEVTYVQEYDRMLYKEFNLNGDLIGLNYMQGRIDTEDFLKDYGKNDEKLLKYIKQFNWEISEALNDAIWEYSEKEMEALETVNIDKYKNILIAAIKGLRVSISYGSKDNDTDPNGYVKYDLRVLEGLIKEIEYVKIPISRQVLFCKNHGVDFPE